MRMYIVVEIWIMSSGLFLQEMHSIIAYTSGMTIQLELSTKPAKALGDATLWEEVNLPIAPPLPLHITPIIISPLTVIPCVIYIYISQSGVCVLCCCSSHP